MTLALYGKSRRRQLTLLALALFAVMAALAGGARLFQPFSASAATTTLDPTTIGAHSAWATVGSGDLTEGPMASCADVADTDGIEGETQGERESYNLNLSGITNGQVITEISIITCNRDASGGGDGGQFANFYRIDGSDSGTSSIINVPNSDQAMQRSVRTFSGLNISKQAGTDLEIGVVMDPDSADASDLVVYSMWVVLTYGDPEPDDDGDGVGNSLDLCPGTPADLYPASQIDDDGCALGQPFVSNPPLPQEICEGVTITLVLDMTGSIESAGQTATIKAGAVGFVQALLPTETLHTIGLVEMSDGSASVVQAPTSNDATLVTAINGLTASGFTDWEAALNAANGQNPAIVVFVTDGDPTSSTAGPDTTAQPNVHLGPAVVAANTVKTNGAHITGIFVGTGTDPLDRLNLITYPDSATGTTFANFGQTLLDQIDTLCAQDGNIYLDKVAANANPAGQEFDLLINGSVAASNSHAEAYEGPFSTAAGTVIVQEELLAGYAYGGVSCRLGATDGTEVATVENNTGGANRRGVEFTLAADTDVYCQFTNRLLPPDEITINAYKVVCDSEADLPNWGDGGANITSATAAAFVDASGGDCEFVNGWAFEWGDGDLVTNPGDNSNGTALADFTTTTSASDNTVPTGQTPAMVTIDISVNNHLWAREKKPAGYLNFSSDTSAPADGSAGAVSAEFYCSADVVNYDNWERIEDTSGQHDLTAGTTYNCVGFNVDVRPGFIEVHKVVTNVVDDPTAFDFSFANPATNFSVVETDASGETRQANVGPQVVTEAAESGYTPLGWARIFGGTACPAAMPTQVSGNVIEFGTDNTAEITIAPNNTTVLCFYNELSLGTITIEKYVWDGNSWAPHAAATPFTFDINPIADIVPLHNDVGPGTYEVPAGVYAVIENDPSAAGYEFVAIFEDFEVCPESPLQDTALALTDPFVNVEVAAGGDVLVCAYNVPVGRLIINKVNDTDDGPFTFDINVNGSDFDTAVGGAAAGQTEVYNELVPAGSYMVTELGVGVFAQCPTAPGVEGIYQLNPNFLQVLDEPGETITFTITNAECPVVAGTGTLVVEKYLDPNGTPDSGDESLLQWTVTVTGPEFPGGQDFVLDGTGNSPAVGRLVLPGIALGPYTVEEATVAGYNQTGLIVNGVSQGIVDTAGVVVAINDTDTVEFYNRPTGSIRVEKSTFRNGAEVNDRGGWTITVSGCGYSDSGVTDASGVVVFDDVPVCANVTVQENANSKPGYTPTGGTSKVVAVIASSTTVVTFRNDQNDGPTPTPTSTPTATPTGTLTPTDTPTNTPTPVSTVAGEITPGTGTGATPIAPSAGTGTAGATSAIAMMLVVLGLFAISSGATILAVARRRN